MSFEFPIALVFQEDIERFDEIVREWPHKYAREYVAFMNALITRRNNDLAFPRSPDADRADGADFLRWFEDRMLEPQPDPTQKH